MSDNKRAIDTLYDELTSYVKKRTTNQCTPPPEITKHEKDELLKIFETFLRKNVEETGIISLDIQIMNAQGEFIDHTIYGAYKSIGGWWDKIVLWHRKMLQELDWIVNVPTKKGVSKFDKQFKQHRNQIQACIMNIWNERHPRIPGDWIDNTFWIGEHE